MAEGLFRSTLLPVATVTPLVGKDVCGVAYCPDEKDHIWAGYRNCVRKVDIKTSTVIMEVATRTGKHCNFLACLSNGDLLISYGGTSHIDMVQRNGMFREFADVKPYKCYDVVVSKKDEIGICLKGGHLAVLSETGQIVARVKMGKMSGFSVNGDGHYMIVDCGSGMNIVTVDGNGQHQRESIKLDQKWEIERIVCDGLGNIIAMNSKQELYVMDRSGSSVVKYKVETEKKVSLNCLAVDIDNNLIFGTTDGKVLILRYLQ
ncbi:hypothetical protein FSP39_024888 [Pinctada imbricata]|uniref:Uncharacterized protein n=1 Tax=Pinctada imbricata TaxID=66713 RepID=A0AA88YU28_PINIB|nr:hypothetical protein FSP39_024888 [Pinctada imbricata]